MAVLKTPVPEGFTISFRRDSRWTWRQLYKPDSPDHETERGGFKSRNAARNDLLAELQARRAKARADKATAASAASGS